MDKIALELGFLSTQDPFTYTPSSAPPNSLPSTVTNRDIIQAFQTHASFDEAYIQLTNRVIQGYCKTGAFRTVRLLKCDLATVYFYHGDWKSALEQLSGLIKLSPETTPSQLLLANTTDENSNSTSYVENTQEIRWRNEAWTQVDVDIVSKWVRCALELRLSSDAARGVAVLLVHWTILPEKYIDHVIDSIDRIVALSRRTFDFELDHDADSKIERRSSKTTTLNDQHPSGTLDKSPILWPFEPTFEILGVQHAAEAEDTLTFDTGRVMQIHLLSHLPTPICITQFSTTLYATTSDHQIDFSSNSATGSTFLQTQLTIEIQPGLNILTLNCMEDAPSGPYVLGKSTLTIGLITFEYSFLKPGQGKKMWFVHDSLSCWRVVVLPSPSIRVTPSISVNGMSVKNSIDNGDRERKCLLRIYSRSIPMDNQTHIKLNPSNSASSVSPTTSPASSGLRWDKTKSIQIRVKKDIVISQMLDRAGLDTTMEDEKWLNTECVEWKDDSIRLPWDVEEGCLVELELNCIEYSSEETHDVKYYPS
jgi:hypothetical protein